METENADLASPGLPLRRTKSKASEPKKCHRSFDMKLGKNVVEENMSHVLSVLDAGMKIPRIKMIGTCSLVWIQLSHTALQDPTISFDIFLQVAFCFFHARL